jgi:hypothetical protein
MENEFEERARKEKTPIQYRIYKGIKGTLGALRFTLKRPYTNVTPKKAEGFVFLEVAPAIGQNVYDWENQKITMALSVNDISKIILYLRSPNNQMFAKTDQKLKLMHDKGAGTASRGQEVKTLQIEKPEGMINFMCNMFENSNGKKINTSVTISPDEALIIGTLLQAAIPVIMCWTPGPNS